jgi:hypothetical protein
MNHLVLYIKPYIAVRKFSLLEVNKNSLCVFLQGTMFRIQFTFNNQSNRAFFFGKTSPSIFSQVFLKHCQYVQYLL